ncbi:MAG TPA: hypothetical protein DEP84_09660, partial [Chloroflexi bacterium]|nr:hypothetical protein [Chloroflexota bacterium]
MTDLDGSLPFILLNIAGERKVQPVQVRAGSTVGGEARRIESLPTPAGGLQRETGAAYLDTSAALGESELHRSTVLAAHKARKIRRKKVPIPPLPADLAIRLQSEVAPHWPGSGDPG